MTRTLYLEKLNNKTKNVTSGVCNDKLNTACKKKKRKSENTGDKRIYKRQ
jgi:hypothetical protein